MNLLKSLPKVDKFVNDKAFEACAKPLITAIAKDVINNTRTNILNKECENFTYDELIEQVLKQYNQINSPSLQKVINATGIIVHTNLGRSLINPESFDRVKEVATSYNNLEYSLKEGKRGERYSHIVDTLQSLTGCEDAIVVNNNASAVFLILNTFAKNKEVVVSRGELVEIGGSFRVPEVMTQSGANLKEIGTTNKTHLRDYENAINENTSMLMKVHKSNYSIEGFTSEVLYEDIIKVANDNNVIDYYDMGSGHMIDLPYNLDLAEPSLLKYMEHKPSLLSFSGDKLLGSVQAGIIVGKKELIAKIKKNQLLRMLRVDKITLALLEDNLTSYLKGEIEDIPTLKMLFEKTEVLEKRAFLLKENIQDLCKCEVIHTQSLIGGGTTPNKKIPTVALSLEYKNYKPNKIEQLLRAKNLIVRIESEKVLIDFRSINESEIKEIETIIRGVFN
ncbi:L-seryl-tRNA(Sec) selenium transferase [Poseidonibacter lekithochrous]|uniref:L-seryl-tRNA(Sec) selenium transferase n=1 Tax=Poseidonibacter lekithochrous TaxID=1904463 RepID=UPI0008FC6965|nr:L-seryl-tRNA(Sec) selenium transferase [Poseidonibacter lekithochrous]QKJ22580.1 selenocysteine synthase [Poseidonibacter lekithochrous]